MNGTEEPQTEPDVEPVIDTPVLNMMCEHDTPLPGDFRQSVYERVRYNVKRRRTSDAIADRLSQNAVRPIVDGFEGEVSDRIKTRIKARLDG
ncbi:MAG: hypothetical protein J07AB43_01290 [Candidatus Nanosalina sp. J07AB43]|nr:MAG: hypothetical protein J07AB43_01290 [Candidatus Nanosalina sp. J07AB43]